MRPKERKQNTKRFTVAFPNGTATEFVEIHECRMDGWILYECFYLPSFEICYFSWDEDADVPEWIDMEQEVKSERVSILRDELIRYKRAAA